VIYNAQGEVDYVSDSFTRIFGWTLKDLAGKKLDYVPETEAEITAATVHAVMHGGIPATDFETKRLTKAGSMLDVRVAASRFHDHQGNPAGMLVILTDITQRKRAENALLESEERYRKLVECLPDGVGIHIDGKIVFVNPAAARDLGAEKPEDIVGRPITDFIHSDSLLNIAEWLEKVVAEGASGPMQEHKLVRMDGRMIDAELAATSFPYYGRQALLTVGRDITARKKAEQAIKTMNEELERRVAERTAQLEAANKELEAFAYSVSHDLRAPLRGMDGFSRVLLEDYAHVLDNQAKEYLHRIRRAARRMAQLIDDLLVLSRVTRRSMQREKVDLSALALNITGELRKNDADRQVECILQPGLVVEGDRSLLRVMLENLIRNAWKFTRAKERAKIEFGLYSGTDSNAEVNAKPIYFVRDNGAGYDMAYADKLFSPFHRLHRPSEFPGTGIGLATAQRIIHRHGGKIWGEGVVDGGATFYFTL
jgi:PAS domain S-box-containing protein